ncbi:MAG: 1-deoxy-D-xylulose-5-phosphate reductoisomerase, partial [Litoreibacter sp.]|nr:1-deoxy-D-xylulose-5-phosphate reductoisomerase [Litoreibacter sp.]
KEIALDGFIGHQIGFLQMSQVVERTLDHIDAKDGLNCDTIALDKVVEMDHLARRVAQSVILELAD